MPPSPELIRAALAHVPANLPRDEWARVAMAIKSELPGDDGAALFEQWSATGEGFSNADCQSTWRSVKPGGGVTIATLLHLAKQHGFVVPKDGARASSTDLVQLAKDTAARQRATQADKARRDAGHEAAAELARAFWDGECQDVSDPAQAPYLVRKGVQAHGVRHGAQGVLCVPLRDAEGTLWNVQRIAAQAPGRGPDKLFFKGARKSGLWHWCGAPAGAGVIAIAEGYATAASVHEASGYPVAVAFDAGNLLPVARELRRLHPAALLVLCADDDAATSARTGVNTGRVKADAAARAVHGVVALPAGAPAAGAPVNWDFNDQHAAHGLDAVRAAIQAAVTADHGQQGRTPTKPEKPRQRPGNGGDDGDALGAPEVDRRDPFEVTQRGVFFHGFDRNGNALAPLWLCSRLDVSALTRDQDGQGWGYLLQFADPLGTPKQWAMPGRMLAGDGGEYRAALLGMGLRIATGPAARNRLTEYIQTRAPEVFASCTDRIGWHSTPEGGAAYVLPKQTIGDAAEQIVFQSESAMENTFRQRKDAAAWRDRIGALCAGNTRLIFAVSCAFAGPLLRPLGMESGGFHLRGDSSSGKTTALRVAASVNGGPSYMQRWRTTDNALESIAAQHCDALLILDELAQVEGRVAGECAYMLANEQSKARAHRGGAPRARLSWRLLFLSAGELGLAAHMAEGMKRARTGQEVRMADIPADAGAGMGAFQNIHGHATPAAFAAHLGREVQAVYGAPGLAFIEWLVAQWPLGLSKRLRDGVRLIVDTWVPADASGQVQRVAARFALVAMAGELATEAGLTGWDPTECEWAARECFEAWIASRGGMGNGELLAMLRQVRRFLEAHGEGRFTWWHRGADDHNAKTLQRVGYRRLVNEDGTPHKLTELKSFTGSTTPADKQAYVDWADEEVTQTSTDFFILPEAFRSEVCQGFTPDAVARALLERGCLIVEKGRYTVKTRLPGMSGATRCYHVTPKIFEIEI